MYRTSQHIGGPISALGQAELLAEVQERAPPEVGQKVARQVIAGLGVVLVRRFADEKGKVVCGEHGEVP